MALAVYGKHPAKGDFLEYGLPAWLKPVLEGWLDAVLAEARAELGPAWEQVWRDAPLVRFWIGEGVWGQPVAGVMAASQDRVGRRFPLVMLCAGDEATRLPAPTIGDDGGWYDAMAAHLTAQLAARDLAVPSDLLIGAVSPPDLDAPGSGPDSFWAVRPGASVAGLLADIALTDHRRAAAGRSYWWVAGQDTPVAAPAPAAEALPEPAADPAPEPEAEPADQADDAATEADTALDLPEGPPPQSAPPPDAWNLPEPALAEEDDSPFASGAGLSLFAAPMPADPALQVAAVAPPVTLPPPAPRILCSQVWAGTGLPGGQVLSWFLRGVDQNG